MEDVAYFSEVDETRSIGGPERRHYVVGYLQRGSRRQVAGNTTDLSVFRGNCGG